MTNQDFKAWFQGFITLSKSISLTAKQKNIIENHARLVRTIDGSFSPENRILVDSYTRDH